MLTFASRMVMVAIGRADFSRIATGKRVRREYSAPFSVLNTRGRTEPMDSLARRLCAGRRPKDFKKNYRVSYR